MPEDRPQPEQAARPAERTEAPGSVGDLLTDLRRAAGYIGAAVDVLRRRQPEIDALTTAAEDQRDGVTF